MNIRPVCESDHDFVVAVINDWWGGRDMASMVSRDLFVSPHETSRVVEEDSQIIAFFLTSVGIDDLEPNWCNWIGVHPAHRHRGIGQMLYKRFANKARKLGCRLLLSNQPTRVKVRSAFIFPSPSPERRRRTASRSGPASRCGR